jgi:putative flippase GtrA
MTASAQRTTFDLPARLPRPLQPLARMMPELSYYTIVSALALAVDLVIFNMLAYGGMRASLAGIAGYCTGLMLHYLLSKHYVFETATSDKTEARRFFEFCVSGAVGALITWAIIGMATEWLHFPAMIGKIAAVGTSFIVVFALRKSIVFATARN